MHISAQMANILQRNKAIRTKEERIATLETENATLHLQIAQLQNSFKVLLQRKMTTNTNSSCKQCDIRNSKLLLLQEQVQALKEKIKDLQSICDTHQQLLNRTLPTVASAILQKQTCQLAKFNVIQGKYQEERKIRKELHNELIELRGNIRVHCRVRPVLQSTDTNRGSIECMSCVDDETVQVNQTQASLFGSSVSEKQFNFDRVHGPFDSQQDVFKEVKPLVTSLLDGYNVCIMAYGQTGSGKTYTMLGAPGRNESSLATGVIPLAVTELFRLIREKDVDYEVTVTVAEIYNDQIRDLLAQGQGKVRHDVVLEHNGDVEVTNLTERLVSSHSELISLVSNGMKRRATHKTNVHEHSSRSHLIVTVHIIGRGEEGGSISAASSFSSLQLNTTITPVSSTETTPSMSPVGSPPKLRCMRSHRSSINISSSAPNLVRTGSNSGGSSRNSSPRYHCPFHVKLQLVDLAGSECVGQSGVGGSNLREAQYINRSLCSLSDVLGALAEKRSHIPYRNSVLTHLLQDSIGGSAKMLMFLCLSPTSQYIGESLRVLGFGARARQVQRPIPAKKTTRTATANF